MYLFHTQNANYQHERRCKYAKLCSAYAQENQVLPPLPAFPAHHYFCIIIKLCVCVCVCVCVRARARQVKIRCRYCGKHPKKSAINAQVCL